ncbi:MAG: DUF2156 domain-containing protein [Candidatus Obscuribacterales bacterium]|nr:DUF2156 domain-containing protein [Candidatus Obscuribacterales bacterium]
MEELESKPQAQSSTNATEDARKRMSSTMKALKVTRRPLSQTLQSLKVEQELLQTALMKAKNPNLSKTAGFRLDKLKQFGFGSLAYSSLQAGMQYYMHEDLGYVSYVPLGDSPDSVLVLSDPLCSREKLKEFMDEFLKVKKDPVFLHISHAVACDLADRGYVVNELGVETVIEIQDFEITGNKKQQLKSARNKAQKDGIKVRELHSVDDSLLRALKQISDEWISAKVAGNSEMKFLVRPIIYVDEVDVRRFIAIKDDEIVGFVIFDPMYENGEVVGYIANQLRSNYEKGYSIVDYIILEAMKIFKEEGKRDLSLGFSPMYKVDDGHEFKHSKLLKAHFQFAYEKANYLYNFKNLARHKSQYRPEMKGAREEKIYCAMKTRFFLNRMHSVYTALGLKPMQATVNHLKHVIVDKIKSVFPKRKSAPAITHDCASESDEAK